MEHRIKEPFTTEKFSTLKAGDTVLLTGVIYTARDAAHKRIVELLDKGETLPFEMENAVIYAPKIKVFARLQFLFGNHCIFPFQI